MAVVYLSLFLDNVLLTVVGKLSFLKRSGNRSFSGWWNEKLDYKDPRCIVYFWLKC